MLFFHPVRRARRAVTPRSVRRASRQVYAVRHPGRAALSSATRRRPARRKKAATGTDGWTPAGLLFVGFGVAFWVLLIAHYA